MILTTIQLNYKQAKVSIKMVKTEWQIHVTNKNVKNLNLNQTGQMV
jgi:hypothetical protein